MNQKTRGNLTQISQAVNHCIPQHKVQNRLAVGVLALGMALSVASPVSADTFTVTNTNSSGAGSLLEAVDLADANPGKDIINFSSVTGDISLEETIMVNDLVDIVGPGRDQLTININNGSSNSENAFLFNAYSDGTSDEFSLSGVTVNATIRNAGGNYQSGGESLNLRDVSAAGISSVYTSIAVQNSTIGGISAFGGYIKATNLSSGFVSLGGDKYTGGSLFNCDNCIIEGGGYVDQGSRLSIKNSTAINSSFGAAGQISIENSVLSGGGGLSLGWGYGVNGGGYGHASIVNSLIENSSGSGIFSGDGSSFTIINSTISNSVGPGIINDGSSGEVRNSTITGNNGGIDNRVGTGNYNYGKSASLIVQNSIIASNGSSDIFGDTPVKIDHSLIQNLAGTVIDDVIPGSNLSNVDPLLAALADNGGPTPTHALLSDSPAIDVADSATCTATDQRSISRPQGAGCDMGAYEVETTVTPPPAAICDIAPAAIRGNCAGEVTVTSIAELDAYVASNFGRHTLANGKRSFKNLRLRGNLGQPGISFTASSPCTVILNANSSITGSDVTLHARQGLNVNWSADIEATGEVCLIADKQHALLNGGNVVNANTLAIRGAKKTIVGFQAALTVHGAAELISTGTGGNSNTKVGNKTTVTAESFKMQADNIAELAFKANVTTTGELSITSGNLATSETLLTNRSSAQAGTDLTLNSAGKTRIGFHATVTAGNKLDVNASTEAECSVASITSTTYSSKSGNCSSKLP